MQQRIYLAIAAIFVLSRMVGVRAGEIDAGSIEAIFEMREISALEKQSFVPFHKLPGGQHVECSTEPDNAVKAYPKLKSKQPLFGKVQFDHKFFDGKGIEFRFVLDESGETSPIEQQKEEAKSETPKKEPSLWQFVVDKLFGSAEKPAPPKKPSPPLKKEPKTSRYDRLYFDINRDLDLTNDPAIKPMEHPPWQALMPWPVAERMAFNCLDVAFDCGPGVGKRPFRIIPWLAGNEHEGKLHWSMRFVATVARKGQIHIGQHKFEAFLAQSYFIMGRFDRPWTDLYLKPADPKDKLESRGFWESANLMGMQQFDGKLYSFAASPLGDKLTVSPYRGDYGVFTIGPGRRDIKNLSFYGSLRSVCRAVGVGQAQAGVKETQRAREFKVPVGDYVPSYLSIEYGRLKINISDNYHRDGRPRDMDRVCTYGINIRKDKKFVLDFSNKPEVLFASPGKDKTFKPDDKVEVKAVLIDPKLDIMIRGLSEAGEKKVEKKPNGAVVINENSRSLDPTVTVRDSAGKKVAEGPMPFG